MQKKEIKTDGNLSAAFRKMQGNVFLKPFDTPANMCYTDGERIGGAF